MTDLTIHLGSEWEPLFEAWWNESKFTQGYHTAREAWFEAWKSALNTDIYEDVYEQCQELINPHIIEMQHGSACGDRSLCASVVGSLGFLIEFWLKHRGASSEYPDTRSAEHDFLKYNGVDAK